jgi:ketosteroid isomerase-like protein
MNSMLIDAAGRKRLVKHFDAALNSGLTSGTPMLRWLPIRSLPLLMAILLVAASQAQGHPQRRERKHLEREQIVALEHDWQQAALSEDVSEMDKLLSDDYIGITSTGEVVTKTQQLDHMRERKFVITQLHTSELKIKLIGNIAIVTSLAQVQGSSDGDPLGGAYRYTRVYQRVANGIWKITNFEVTPTSRLHAIPQA